MHATSHVDLLEIPDLAELHIVLVRQAVKRLPPLHRQVVELVFLAQKPVGETARKLDVNDLTFKQTLSDALDALFNDDQLSNNSIIRLKLEMMDIEPRE